MANEKCYNVVLKHSQVRELQQALLYHVDCVMVPYLDRIAKQQDYDPTDLIRHKITVLQGILDDLNRQAGPFKETE